MNNIFKILPYSFLFIIVLAYADLYAQKNKMEFEHISIEQGLSSNGIWSIFHDNRGFIWLATSFGLHRYDGYKFKVFRHDDDDSTSLSDNLVLSIYEDKSGVLWLGTLGGGLNKYDKDKEKFTRYLHNPADPTSIGSNIIRSISEDKFGILWIGTQGGGLNKFDIDNEKFTRYLHNPTDPTSLSNDRVHSFYKDKSGILWIGTQGGGLNKYDNEKEQFIRYQYNPTDPTSLSNNYIYSIYEDKSGYLWIGTEVGLNKFDKDREEFTRYKYNPKDPTSLSSNRVNSIYEDNSGVLWIGTDTGLNKFDQEEKKFTRYQYNPNDPTSLSSKGIGSIYEYNAGILWIGTSLGLDKFDKDKEVFTRYQYDPNDPTSLSNNFVGSIYEDNSGVLWIGTNDGLNKFDKVREEFTRYRYDPNDPTSLGNITSIYEDKSGILWIGTFEKGLNKFDKDKQEFTRYENNPDDPTSLSNDRVWSICEDNSGVLWIGTSDGLNKFDKDKQKFTRYQHNPDDPTSLSHSRVSSIYKDNSGVLWIATWEGLNKYDKDKEGFTRYQYNPNDSTSLSHNYVLSVYEDKSGVFWVATLGGGLNKFDRKKEKFLHYGKANGLLWNLSGFMFEDEHGNLWISTEKGIVKFNPRNGTFKNCDALPNGTVYYKSKSGEIYCQSGKGFFFFHPDSIKDNPHIPPVVITDFLMFNKSVPIGYDKSTDRIILEKSIIETKEIELTHEDYVISFEFAALDFHSPGKNKYAYIMEGFEKEWNFTESNKRFATYTNLHPGEYTFRVKGSNNDGVWNEVGAAIKIIIIPPWWATWWAYTFYVLFALGLLYSSWRYESNRIGYKHSLELKKVEAEKLLETDRMKSRFFANISHEFRTPLTLILGPAEKIVEKSKDEEIHKQTGLIKINANRLLGLINQLLDLSKLEAGKLKLQSSKGNIVSFTNGITMSFESVAERKDIKLKFSAAKDEIDLYFDRDKMAKILTNLLSNAFKFTGDGGEITVSISETGKDFIGIKVKDTGIGIPEEELHKLFERFYQVDASHTREYGGTGIGLALTKELVELHRGFIKVSSKLGEGSEFTIELPLGRDHLSDDEIFEVTETAEESKVIDENIFTAKKEAIVDEDFTVFSDDKTIILVVEDNTDVRNFIKESLGDEFAIDEASDGEQGVRKAIKIIPDLIISDVMMPKMDGNELTRILKHDEKTSHIPIILLTAKSEQESKLEGLETGADDYLIKPFDVKELRVRIKNLINIRRSLQEKYSRGNFVLVKRGEEKKLSSIEEQFMCKVMEVIEKHLSEEEFSVEQFGEELGMGRVQIFRKLKALTGLSPSKYITSKKLGVARRMILEKKGNISEIAYSVGFGSPTYFTRCFKEEFGCLPSDLLS